MSEKQRNLVIVSGYYGFGNLGDEAILEQLVSELKCLVLPDHIVVLSANPAATEKAFGVKAAPRADLCRLLQLCAQAQLLISGGGGLFQDSRSVGSALFYSCHIAAARLAGAQAMIYAQGLGPLQSDLALWVSRCALSLCDVISVRDTRSAQLVSSWGLTAELTADPVWALQPSPLPIAYQRELDKVVSGRERSAARLVGLSLRPSVDLTDAHLTHLLQALQIALPQDAVLVLLPLQKEKDYELLDRFYQSWVGLGRQGLLIDPAGLILPSQWLSLFSQLDFVVSMRLHALIMALHSGVPVVGISYDPKVSSLLAEFEQPALNLTKETSGPAWSSTIKEAMDRRAQLVATFAAKAEAAKNMACQNFSLISRILQR